MLKALKLDSSFKPIEVIDALEALILCIIGKARAIETYEEKVNSVRQSFDLPAVIVINRYVKYRMGDGSPTRQNIIWRDRNICQYCAKDFKTSELTIDHILPKSRGGKNTWENLVAACVPCNQKKGAKTAIESGMHPIRKPFVPRDTILKNVPETQMSETWKNYLWNCI
jgi:5-methylcytosine-specific restriction endonuclease McrA